MNHKLIKYLSFGVKNFSGINNLGRNVVKSKGRGKSKRKFRILDFYRNQYNIPAIVIRLEYDPFRNTKIALICYQNGILSYIIAPEGLKKNNFLNLSYPIPGVVNILKDFQFGTILSCVELSSLFGSKLARSAGCYCILLNHFEKHVILRLPSGEERLIRNTNKAMLGSVSIGRSENKKRKAGQNI
jgi:large subunit ribosomal protein L2